jgi:hypothetical protein
MEIPVLIESLPNGKGYRARAAEPFSVSAESSDRDAAIGEVRKKVNDLVAAGQVVPVNVGRADPMANLIGTIDMNDPVYQKWWGYVEQFRHEMEHIRLAGEGDEDGA